MPETPRKSSIRSSHTARSTHPRLAPSSLRIPSGRVVSPSTASLSLIFASHEASSSAVGTTSEQALAKQLDGDAGGRTMGLRSRRGSSATIRSKRTHSGVSSQSVMEEPVLEDVDNPPEAGPSTVFASPEGSPTAELEAVVDRQGTQRLNPKSSSSWMRWNSPAPSFPRSGSKSEGNGKGKGKGKERADGEGGFGDGSAIPQTESPTNENDASNDHRSDVPPTGSPDHTIPDSQPPHSVKDPIVQPDSATSPTVPPPKPSRWWSRTAPPTATPTTSQPSDIGNNANAANSPGTSPSAQSDLPTPIAPVVARASSTSDSPASRPSAVLGDSPSSGITPVAPIVERADQAHLSNAAERDPSAASQPPPTTSWMGYFARGKAASSLANSEPGDASIEVKAEEPPVAQETPATQAFHEPTEESAEPAKPAINPPLAEPAQPKAGWGTYLYSFVASPATTAPEAQTRADSTDDATIEVNPSKDQKPVPTTPPAVSVQVATPRPVASDPAQAPLPAAVASLASTPTPAPSSPGQRKGSTASQSGWLNYLAFRASQKKIPNASTASIKSGKEKERKSLDGPEDVMDFSNDPNFPGSSGVSIAPSGGEGDKPKDRDLPSAKPTQNLAAKNRRLSNETTKSGHLTPLSSSPKAKPTPKTPSTLPGPSGPAPPAAQPNFVIPTFESTFDKPPRSLPPMTEQSGGTSGLAWKALGAVGSYVYGAGEETKEGKGMREGRRVGADLPRRIGLGEAKGGMSPDDGWKHVKRVVVVGVHGWFPAKMLNSVIGEPTGTSVKFANMMGAAVKRFFDERGVHDIRLTLMPLEGEGTIDSRVDRLYKAYLANAAWINDLRRADAIFFAAHSQGCIVTTHLISRLIAQGHIRTPYNAEAVARCEWAFGLVSVIPETAKKRGPVLSGSEGGYQKVAMLAMCGVHLGPLYSISTSSVIQPYLQWFENAAARELFEFQDTTSAVGTAYQKSLAMILENEVKVVLLASYNDQVVPIYGASFSTATHPLLLRALFVDGASYAASDFMTNLLAFAFMLRNAGIDDQGLVEHLSEATAGSLTGVGHSAPYEDKGAYDLTVKYMFLSGPAKAPIAPLQVEPFAARDVRSDFELPWIMRALVDSPEVRDLFPAELRDLREGVVGWKPVTKALKEIKKRLEPMAGRQSRLRHQGSSATLAGDSASAASAGPTGKVRSRL